VNFRDILDRYNIPYIAEGHEHCRPGWLQLDCPNCSPNSGRWRLGYNLAHHYTNCWQCGRVDLLRFFETVTGASRTETRQALAGIIRERAASRPRGTLKLPAGVGELLPAHTRYLRSRGFDPGALVKLWGLGGIGLAKELQWRVFIPIHLYGDVVSWTTRSISDEHSTRYRSAAATDEAIPHKTILYGEDYARHTAIVVEGPVDAWAGGPGVVGTCGTGFSQSQVARLARYATRVVCFDNAADARKRSRELAMALSAFPGKTYEAEIDAKDLAEDLQRTGGKEIKQLRKHFLRDT